MTSSTTHKTARVILATPRAIFRTLLDPETIPVWRAPEGIAAHFEHFDPRPSGTYRMILRYPSIESGESMPSVSADIIVGEFAEIQPDERIVETIRFETGQAGSQVTLTVTTMLEPVIDGTKVTLIAENVPPGISEADPLARMDRMLRNLANFVERSKKRHPLGRSRTSVEMKISILVAE